MYRERERETYLHMYMHVYIYIYYIYYIYTYGTARSNADANRAIMILGCLIPSPVQRFNSPIPRSQMCVNPLLFNMISWGCLILGGRD